MEFSVFAALGREHASIHQIVESVGQNLERRAAASSRLVRGGCFGQVVRHGEGCAKQARLLPREGQVTGADSAQLLSSIRLLVTARRGGRGGVFHAVRRQPRASGRHGIEQSLANGEVPVGGVGGD